MRRIVPRRVVLPSRATFGAHGFCVAQTHPVGSRTWPRHRAAPAPRWPRLCFPRRPLRDPRRAKARGYETPTPIRPGSIQLLDSADLLGIAQTGTGKAAAFSIPMLRSSTKRTAAAPCIRARAGADRELALQIRDACVEYGNGLGLVTALVFGGVSRMPQIKALQKGVDILVATPGRLLDPVGRALQAGRGRIVLGGVTACST